MQRVIFLLLFFYFHFAQAHSSFIHAQKLLHHSEQLVMVTTANEKSIHGMLQRYRRNPHSRHWIKVGRRIAVVVGKRGMAWGIDFQKDHPKGVMKKEGDQKTPMGVFELGPLFGFAAQSPFKNKFSYLPLTRTSECVDDKTSHYYNQLIDRAKIRNLDWHSSEKMREISQYQVGAVVQYNTHSPIPGAGSCIFLHVWREAGQGTAGCVAMKKSDLMQLLAWLDPRQKPVIAIFSNPALHQSLSL